MMNPYSGFKRARSWDEPEPFGSPKLRRFDDGGAMSRPGGQQYNSQGYQGFHGEPSGDYGHQEQGWSQGAGSRAGFSGGSRAGFNSGNRAGFRGGFGRVGARSSWRGTGSSVGRLMDMASGSGSGSSFAGSRNPSAGSYSQGGDSSFVDYGGYNQHQHSDYGGGGRGRLMHSQPFGGRGGGAGSFGNSRGAGAGRFFGHSGAPRGREIGYETSLQFSSDQRAGGRGGARGDLGQHGGGQRGGRGGQSGGKDTDQGTGAILSRLMDMASESQYSVKSSAGAPRGRERGGRGGGRHGGGGRGGGGRGGSGGKRGGYRGQGSDEDGGRKSGETPGHGGIVVTRPDGSTYRRHEHSLLQYQSKLFQENKLPMVDRFVNLCKMAKALLNDMPSFMMASTKLEEFLLSDNVCLTPAYVFKCERNEDTQPINFTCKVYIDDIFIASCVASSKKKAKGKACDIAIKVLGTKNAQVIINTHEKVNVMGLGKEDADIVDCPLSSTESNIGILLGVRESNEKKSITDFYIREPEVVDEATGMNSTSILRQSADFSKLLLQFEYTTSPLQEGFLCTVIMEGETLATARAAQQLTAKNLASHAALQNLRKTNWTIFVIKRDKPKPAAEPLTATIGRIHRNNHYSHDKFTKNLRAYLTKYFTELDDHTKWLSLSQELNQDEREAVQSVAEEMNLQVAPKRVEDGPRRAKIGKNDPFFLVVSKKLVCHDLFDYIWEKGGETWRYKLKAPGEIEPDSG